MLRYVLSGAYHGVFIAKNYVKTQFLQNGTSTPQNPNTRESLHSPRYAVSSEHKIVAEVNRMNCALNRFISRSTEKCLPFFKRLRKTIIWSDECEEAFHRLKEYLTNPKDSISTWLSVMTFSFFF